MSFPALSELAEMLVSSVERRKAKDVKNAPISLSGSQRISPLRVILTAMPMKLTFATSGPKLPFVYRVCLRFMHTGPNSSM
jgi:hypothetical protein